MCPNLDYISTNMEFNFMKLLPLYATPSSTITLLLFSVYVSIFFCSHTELEAAAMNPSQNLSFPAFFSFGDSIIDTGNNNNLTTTAKCNFPPYGRDFMGGKPTGRFSNGKTPVDLIVETLGIKEILPAYLDPNLQIKDLHTGVNFASGGSGFDPLSSEIANAYSLSDQIDFFKDYIVKLRDNAGEERATSIISRSLYLVAASANDIETAYFNSNIRRLQYHDYPSYASFLVTLASNFFKELYGLGARNFLIVSAPPLGCLPSTITVAGRGSRKECIEKYNQAAQLFNTKLSAEIGSLNNNLPQSRLIYVDIYYSLLDIIQNPNKYGFEIVDRGCCGTGTIEVTLTCNELCPLCEDVSKYIFWDSFHPTERTYKIIVSTLMKKISTAPSN
ncbi:hypothetical protein Dsin_003755 [Dipteronia sinensis]|uniref:Uncharacterized protein n=1 Tax=Dipteronia sinensis TaxID=43782 RepID=A0AAE0BA41_9ROSI|nr:hypothetical protein Dsin_003755 [Dipteronia sinensis]